MRINCDVLYLIFALLLDLQRERLIAETLRLVIGEIVHIYAALLDYLNELNDAHVVLVCASLNELRLDIFNGLVGHGSVHTRVVCGLE